MIDPNASPGCAGRQPTQAEFFDGLRGTIVYDDTRGVPERTKGSKKSRLSNVEGWTAFDVRMARARGVTLKDLDAQRAASRAWIDDFRARVTANLIAQGIALDAPLPGCKRKERL